MDASFKDLKDQLMNMRNRNTMGGEATTQGLVNGGKITEGELATRNDGHVTKGGNNSFNNGNHYGMAGGSTTHNASAYN